MGNKKTKCKCFATKKKRNFFLQQVTIFPSISLWIFPSISFNLLGPRNTFSLTFVQYVKKKASDRLSREAYYGIFFIFQGFIAKDILEDGTVTSSASRETTVGRKQ